MAAAPVECILALRCATRGPHCAEAAPCVALGISAGQRDMVGQCRMLPVTLVLYLSRAESESAAQAVKPLTDHSRAATP